MDGDDIGGIRRGPRLEAFGVTTDLHGPPWTPRTAKPSHGPIRTSTDLYGPMEPALPAMHPSDLVTRAGLAVIDLWTHKPSDPTVDHTPPRTCLRSFGNPLVAFGFRGLESPWLHLWIEWLQGRRLRRHHLTCEVLSPDSALQQPTSQFCCKKLGFPQHLKMPHAEARGPDMISYLLMSPVGDTRVLLSCHRVVFGWRWAETFSKAPPE